MYRFNRSKARISALASLVLFLACNKTVVLVSDKSLPKEKQSRVVVGQYMSIRNIQRVVDGEGVKIYEGYIGESDQLWLEPGDYLLNTKLEFSVTIEPSPNTVTSMEIRPKNSDYLFISVQAGESYVVYNWFTGNSKWVTRVNQLPKSTPAP